MIIALAAGLCGCGLLPVEEELLAPPVLKSYETATYTTARVMRGDLERYVTAGVNYVPTRSQSLSFPESGILYDEINVEVGDTVAAGTVVATLVCKELDDSIEALTYQEKRNEADRKAVTDTYQQQYDAAKLTREKKELTVAYDQRMNELQGEADSITLRLERLRERRANRILTTGMGGVVTYVRKIKEGDTSVQNDTVVIVTDKTNSVFSYTGDQYEAFPPGAEVTITSSKETFSAYAATPAQLGVEAKEKTICFTLAEPTLTLSERASGTVSILAEARTDTLYVPVEAIQTVRDEHFVYMFEDEIRVTRDVITGLETKEFVEILEGLEEGEEVITGGIR